MYSGQSCFLRMKNLAFLTMACLIMCCMIKPLYLNIPELADGQFDKIIEYKWVLQYGRVKVRSIYDFRSAIL